MGQPNLQIPVAGYDYLLPYPQRASEVWEPNSVTHESIANIVHRDFMPGKAVSLLRTTLSWESLTQAEVAVICEAHSLMSDLEVEATYTDIKGDSYTVSLMAESTSFQLIRYMAPDGEIYFDTSLSLEELP